MEIASGVAFKGGSKKKGVRGVKCAVHCDLPACFCCYAHSM